MRFKRNVYTDATVKYLNIFEVLPDFCPSFLWDDDCFVCYIFY